MVIVVVEVLVVVVVVVVGGVAVVVAAAVRSSGGGGGGGGGSRVTPCSLGSPDAPHGTSTEGTAGGMPADGVLSSPAIWPFS